MYILSNLLDRGGLDVTFAVNSLHDAAEALQASITSRIFQFGAIPNGLTLIRTPVALVFVRGDRAAPADTLAKQVVSSYAYWNQISAEYLDIVFLGWYNDPGNIGFNDTKFFIECYEEVEKNVMRRLKKLAN